MAAGAVRVHVAVHDTPVVSRLAHSGVRFMVKSSGKVTIKKYANRRLYDTESSSYITLDRLAQMVREGREFEVVDAKSGEDITRQVLTQIIVDEEARGSTMLPINFLKQLIGLYGNSMQNFVPSYLEAAMDAFQRNQSAVKDAFSGNVFADLAKRNMEMFEGASRAFTGKTARKGEAPAVGASEMDQLKADLAALQAKVDKLSR
jgi:polyhydroxyalkanoate synthesis repressor PhaR